MKTLMLGMLAETFVHYGSDTGGGPVDLPVAREAGTDYPFIAGSGLKGALKDHPYFGDKSKENVKNEIFGEDEGNKGAGKLMFSDARLLLLPVRSLIGAYKWVTCPHLLERFKRDCGRGGFGLWPNGVPKPEVARQKYLAPASGGDLLLEELKFGFEQQTDGQIVTMFKELFQNTDAAGRVDKQLVIVNDEDFGWFAKHGLAIHARNKLLENKTSENLWYEEALPPDTLMYSFLAPRNKVSDAEAETYRKEMKNCFDKKYYLQVGGNETVGQGWFSVKCIEGGQ